MSYWPRIALGFLIVCGTNVARGGPETDPRPDKAKPGPVNFARDVRPILSDNCFACHGPDDQPAQGRSCGSTPRKGRSASARAAPRRSCRASPMRAS